MARTIWVEFMAQRQRCSLGLGCTFVFVPVRKPLYSIRKVRQFLMSGVRMGRFMRCTGFVGCVRQGLVDDLV
jgi:hypothetical protein